MLTGMAKHEKCGKAPPALTRTLLIWIDAFHFHFLVHVKDVNCCMNMNDAQALTDTNLSSP